MSTYCHITSFAVPSDFPCAWACHCLDCICVRYNSHSAVHVEVYLTLTLFIFASPVSVLPKRRDLTLNCHASNFTKRNNRQYVRREFETGTPRLKINVPSAWQHSGYHANYNSLSQKLRPNPYYILHDYLFYYLS